MSKTVRYTISDVKRQVAPNIFVDVTRITYRIGDEMPQIMYTELKDATDVIIQELILQHERERKKEVEKTFEVAEGV